VGRKTHDKRIYLSCVRGKHTAKGPKKLVGNGW
jgi:hypothetical protein